MGGGNIGIALPTLLDAVLPERAKSIEPGILREGLRGGLIVADGWGMCFGFVSSSGTDSDAAVCDCLSLEGVVGVAVVAECLFGDAGEATGFGGIAAMLVLGSPPSTSSTLLLVTQLLVENLLCRSLGVMALRRPADG